MGESSTFTMKIGALIASGLCGIFAVSIAGNALAAGNGSEKSGTQYCVTCFGETMDMSSKRTCYEITAPTQIHMRAFGVRQCTATTGNLWYNFATGSCKGKRYCSTVVKR